MQNGVGKHEAQIVAALPDLTLAGVQVSRVKADDALSCRMPPLPGVRRIQVPVAQRPLERKLRLFPAGQTDQTANCGVTVRGRRCHACC